MTDFPRVFHRITFLRTESVSEPCDKPISLVFFLYGKYIVSVIRGVIFFCFSFGAVWDIWAHEEGGLVQSVDAISGTAAAGRCH